MGLMDNMSGQAKDMMNDPDKRQQIEKMAKEKGISIDQAKEHFTKKENNK
jgi:hypothetical protein